MLRKLWNWLRGSKPENVNPYEVLRQMPFGHKPEDLGLRPTPDLPDVYGAMMEFWAGSAIVTLVSMGEGSTSLYFSTGGAIIGGVQATQQFLGKVQVVLSYLPITSTYPPPSPGNARFFALTYSGVRTLEVDEMRLQAGKDLLSGLYAAAHEVLTWIRLTTDSQQQS